jgi:hypothetical protein
MTAADLVDPSCSCCTGLGPQTPLAIANAPGLAAIVHRAGTHASFKASLLAALSRRDVPALAGLGSRSDDDFTIGLIDGFATMADVLTFYSERIANEAFLRTALERRSIGEMARLIGYRLAPGLAAETYLAFTIDPPLPGVEGRPVTIESGSRVQSVPGPGEAAQTFETVEPIAARDAWNSLALQTSAPQATAFAQRELIIAGTGHGLVPGDAILLVGDERLGDPGSERWDARLLRTVEVDQSAGTTRVTWLEGLGSVFPRVNPAAANVRAYVFRQRASIFGHNAPDPRLMSLSDEAKSALVDDLPNGLWKGFGLSGRSIDLDQSYPKVVPDSWLVLLSEKIAHRPSSLPGYGELYRARTVGHQSVSAFGLASKVTRVGLDSDEHLDWFSRRETLVLCQSEELPLTVRPVRAPVYGSSLSYAGHVPDLAKGQALALSGSAQHVRVSIAGAGSVLDFGAGSVRSLAAGDRLALAAPPTADDGAGGRRVVGPSDLEAQLDPVREIARPSLWWSLADRDGRVGMTRLTAAAFVLDAAIPDTPGAPGDPALAEITFIASTADAVDDDRDRTTLRLAEPLRGVYDRATVRINANVARATHGETVRELLGSGDGSQANQRLRLRQSPLTFVGSDAPSGAASTLEIRVDGTKWMALDSLFGAAAQDRAYAVEIDDDASTEVVFGDGNEGARLSTGAGNVRARYRKGIGAAGNVRAGQLTSPLVAPVGVRAVTNPEPATGGVEAEPAGLARRNAPQTVLTLGRAVSRRDYEDFAASFAGIAKATAAWIPTGAHRGIVVTVAGPDGAEVRVDGEVHDRLLRSLTNFGDSTLAVRVVPYRKAAFALGMKVKVDPLAEVSVVLAGVRTATQAAFAFDARGFGDGVAIDEVDAVAHGVAGVVAIDVTTLRRLDQPTNPPVNPRLFAWPTAADASGLSGAELLTLDPVGLEIGVLA